MHVNDDVGHYTGTLDPRRRSRAATVSLAITPFSLLLVGLAVLGASCQQYAMHPCRCDSRACAGCSAVGAHRTAINDFSRLGPPHRLSSAGVSCMLLAALPLRSAPARIVTRTARSLSSSPLRTPLSDRQQPYRLRTAATAAGAETAAMGIRTVTKVVSTAPRQWQCLCMLVDPCCSIVAVPATKIQYPLNSSCLWW